MKITIPAKSNQVQALRDFAERLVRVHTPSLEEAIAVVAPYYPELLANTSATEVLERVGIVVIADIGQRFRPMRLSWSIASTSEEVQEQVTFHSHENMVQIRKTLGIDSQWIFWVPDEDLERYDIDSLIDGSITFDADGSPSVFVLDEFK